jgi:hypothetical protein
VTMPHSTKRRIIILPQYVKTPSPKGFQALSQGLHPLAAKMHSAAMARRIIILPQYVKTPSPKGFHVLSQGIHPLARGIHRLPWLGGLKPCLSAWKPLRG